MDLMATDLAEELHGLRLFAEVPDVLEAVLTTYRDLRQPGERFVDAVRRLGIEPFKEAGKAARHPAPEMADAL